MLSNQFKKGKFRNFLIGHVIFFPLARDFGDISLEQNK